MTQSNETAPRVSVVMSVYNGQSQVDATIESILSQSFDDFEFIIIDDGSTDDSAVRVKQYADKDPRVVLVSQKNGGLTRALRVGCERARGELIARQDVGDRSHRERLRKQVNFLDEYPDVVAVGAGCRRIGPRGEFLGDASRDLGPKEVTAAFLNEGVGISHTVAMFRKGAYDKAGGYRTAFRFAQDTDLWYRMSRVGLIGEHPDVLFEWGIDIDGISSSSHDRQRALAAIARESYDCIERGESDETLLRRAEQVGWGEISSEDAIAPRDAVANAEFFIGSQLFCLGDPRCRRYLMRAIRHRPFWLRPWAKFALSYIKMEANDA